MPGTPLFYRARIRNAADSADDLVVTSQPPSGTNPYLTGPPTGDGASLDILSGAIQQGALQIRLADAITSNAATRVLTAILADAAGKQQLLSRIVVIEESVDGVAWVTYFRGYLRRARLVTALEWEITVGDVTRAEGDYLAFATLTTAFPKGVNLIGEPILGGWGPIPAIGQTTFKVVQVTTRRVRLQYMYGPLPPDYVYKQSSSDAHYLAVNKLARPFAVPTNQYQPEDTTVRANFPRLEARVFNPTTGALVGTFTPVEQPATPIAGDPVLQRRILEAHALLSDLGAAMLWLDWRTAQPALNTLFAVRVAPIDVSTLNPLHVEGHPVDIWTALYTEAGIPWSATAAAALKDSLGQTLRFRGRFTAGAPLGELMARLFGGPLGIGVRTAADGTRELIAVRDLPTTLPGVAVTVNELRNDDGVIFDLDDASVVSKVTWKIENYAPWDTVLDGGSQPNDLVVVKPITYQTINGDAAGARGKEQTYEVAGHFYDSRGAQFYDPIPFFAAQASRVFDRFGRGGIRSEVQVLRGTSPALGSFITLNVPHLPVAVQGATPVSQRGQAARAVQVERLRPNPEGPILTVLDCGRNALPAVNPILTFAVAANDPIHYAEVTVTNAAALSAAGIERVNFQMGTGVGTPTGGIDFAARGLFELLAVNVVPLPKCAAGETVWVRAQSKDSQAMFPGPWTAWVSVALTALAAPSGLTVNAGANDTEKIIRWNLANTELPVMIRWKLTGDSDWSSSASLPPGTVEYTLRDLIPGGGGISGQVTVIDWNPSPGESPAAAFSFTPGAVSPVLPIPWSPAGWCGPQDALSVGSVGLPDGSFGLDVTAAQWPCFVEVEMALETGIGTGVYGTFVTQLSRLVQQGYRTRTRFSFYAGNDRLRRKMRARHNQPGYTASGYTDEVVVAPWVAQKAIIPAIPSPAFSVGTEVGGTYENPLAFALVKYTIPPNPHFDYVRYRLRQRQIGASAWGSDTFVVGGRDGDDLVQVDWGVEAEIRLDTVNTDGVIYTAATPVAILTPTMPDATLWRYFENYLYNGGGAGNGEYQTGDVGREPARLNFPFMGDEQCIRVEFYSEEHTTDPGPARDLYDGRAPELIVPVVPARANYFAAGAITASLYMASLPLAAPGNYRLVTIIPINRIGRPGARYHLKAQGDATALPPAVTAASNFSISPAGGLAGGVFIDNTTVPTSSPGVVMRRYRNGMIDFDFGTSLTIGHWRHIAVSLQEERFEYCFVSSIVTPREGPRSPAFQVSAPLYQLEVLPTFAAAQFNAVLVVSDPGWITVNPPNTFSPYSRGRAKTKAILRRGPTAAGPWTEVGTMEWLQKGFQYVPPVGTYYFSVIFRSPNWTDSAISNVLGPFTF